MAKSSLIVAKTIIVGEYVWTGSDIPPGCFAGGDLESEGWTLQLENRWFQQTNTWLVESSSEEMRNNRWLGAGWGATQRQKRRGQVEQKKARVWRRGEKGTQVFWKGSSACSKCFMLLRNVRPCEQPDGIELGTRPRTWPAALYHPGLPFRVVSFEIRAHCRNGPAATVHWNLRSPWLKLSQRT